jgi:hypothetical protein
MKEVLRAVGTFCRRMRQFATSPAWPALRFRQSDLSRSTVTMSLREDLKLFADAMMKRVGKDYFLLTTSQHRVEMAHARAFRSAGDEWRDFAP